MLGIRLAFGGLLTTIIITTFSFSQLVSLEFRNINTSAGTLDIYMTNQSGCSYCSDPTYNNHGTTSDIPKATDQKRLCEDETYTAGGIWTNDNTISETDCLAIPSIDGEGGFWFDGDVKGIQFLLEGITVTNISGGVSEQYYGCGPPTCGAILLNNSTDEISGPDCDNDGVDEADCNNIITTSFGASVIPSSSAQLFMSLEFTDFNNESICFAGVGIEATGGWSPPVISDSNAYEVVGDWGGCYCASGEDLGCGCGNGLPSGCDNECLSEAVIDCAGICGGSAVDGDADGVCDGVDNCPNGATDAGTGEDDQSDTDEDGVGDACDACAGTAANATVDAFGCSDEQNLSVLQVGTYLPNEFTISQNFPNPFNPVTNITFDVAQMDEISLVVYDLTGNEIVTLVSGTYAPGRYQVDWQAVNNTGDGISSGMYIYRYISSEKAITRKMLYLK